MSAIEKVFLYFIIIYKCVRVIVKTRVGCNEFCIYLLVFYFRRNEFELYHCSERLWWKVKFITLFLFHHILFFFLFFVVNRNNWLQEWKFRISLLNIS